ncbi:MAG: hypothetical protein BroJett024_44080 [Alphaproteobacteria bacterium]|nr:MAG: hypothetical protein BroJett024_44080 [Alphaproteobacteria bacterium]
MIQTDDIFLSGYLLLRGGELVSVEVRCFGRRPVAVFTIGGQAASAAEREYHRGEATVDLRLLKSEVRRLKDVAFQAIRKEERRAGQQGRDRTNQGSERAGLAAR